MPRIARSLLLRARAIDPYLPLLLKPCRDLPSAVNELRWLREHVQRDCSHPTHHRSLLQLCQQRSKGVPLQYLLGTQPFGDLEIICKPKVLIPRVDTESYTTRLAQLIINHLQDSSNSSVPLFAADRSKSFRILDACTGTGCIALLLHTLLAQHISELQIQGVDISAHALTLAQKNLHHNVQNATMSPRAFDEVSFRSADILTDSQLGYEGWDVIVSNPPYISRESFYKQTASSVRHFEPRLALVPQREGEDVSGDVFYGRLMDIGQRAEAKLLVMEVEDAAQAMRVLHLASLPDRTYWTRYALWHDDVAWNSDERREEKLSITGSVIHHEGTGNIRAVVLTRASCKRVEDLVI